MAKHNGEAVKEDRGEVSQRDDDDDEHWREKPERLVASSPSLVQTAISTEIFTRSDTRVRLRKENHCYSPVYQVPGFEVCVAVETAAAAVRAVEGGATRLELYMQSAGEIRATANALRQLKQPLPDLYLHLNKEHCSLNQMEKLSVRMDLALGKHVGAKGVVLGALDANNYLDADFLEQLVKLAKPLKIAFGAQAFEALLKTKNKTNDSLLDLRSRRLSALDSLIDLGLSTVYIQDLHALQDTIDLARGRITIVAAIRENDGTFLSSDFAASLLRGIQKTQKSNSPKINFCTPSLPQTPFPASNFIIQLHCPPPFPSYSFSSAASISSQQADSPAFLASSRKRKARISIKPNTTAQTSSEHLTRSPSSSKPRPNTSPWPPPPPPPAASTPLTTDS